MFCLLFSKPHTYLRKNTEIRIYQMCFHSMIDETGICKHATQMYTFTDTADELIACVCCSLKTCQNMAINRSDMTNCDRRFFFFFFFFFCKQLETSFGEVFQEMMAQSVLHLYHQMYDSWYRWNTTYIMWAIIRQTSHSHCCYCCDS